jgi:streptogramin lyase
VPGNHVARLPRVAKIIRHIGHEPNGIVEAGGSLWVTSLTRKRLTLIDPHTGRERRRHPVIGLGAKAPTVGGGSVWVPMSTGNAVLRLDPRSGRVIQRVVTALPPFQVAMGRNDVWILTRAGSPNPDVVLHYDASATHLLSSTVITAGATAIAAHDGTAWAAGLRGSWIFRIAAEDGQPHFWRPLLEPATTLAYGAGFLWASLPAAGAVARIDPASHRVTVTTAVGSRPTGIVVAHGRVFVACTNDHTVVMLNPRTARRVGRPLHVAVNPYAETADRRHVWVTGVGANTVTRIDYR